MNFDSGQGLKFGLPNCGPGFENPGNVCQFQYVGLENMPGAIKQGQAMPSMPPNRSGSLGPHYRNMNVRHPQGSPVQNAFPIGVNISMATSPQFNTMQPLDSFAMHQGYPTNQRPEMHYKMFNNWIGPAQGNVLQGHSQPRQQAQPPAQVPQSQAQASLPSFGHLWSHFQQQQMQKQQALQQQDPQQQQKQQQQSQLQQQNHPQQQQFIGNQPLQMSNYPNTVALIPNIANNSINLQRGQKVNYQYSTQNVGVVTQARVCPSFAGDGSQTVAHGNPTVSSGETEISMVVAAASNLAACSLSAASSVVVSSGSSPVTNTTTTVTMTTCSSSPVTTTATVHSGVPVTSVGPMKDQLSSEVEKNQSETSVEKSCAVKVDNAHDGQGENGNTGKCKNSDGTLQIVKVPFGWRRTTEDGAVVYYSPSNTRMTSYHEVCKYLVSDGTCKCGIECPLQVEKVFNFDPYVNGKLWTVDDVSTEDLTKLCIHKRKIIAMATFQRSRSIPGGMLSVSHGAGKPGTARTKRESKTRKKLKNKVNATPYDGLLVSQLLAQRANSPQVLNHKTPQSMAIKNIAGDLQFSPPNHLTCNALSNLGANAKLHHQSADIGEMASPLSADLLHDPMDDLGPITCQVPAKLDFSTGCVLNNPAHRLASSAVAHDVSQILFPTKNLSPQAPFSPDHLKNQQVLLQQHSPVQCVPASPFVPNVPNHMYGPNIPQHFQVPLNLQQQQQPGNMMFHSLMQVQNASGQHVQNPQMFEPSGMQANPVHIGPQQHNLMFNSLYPQLSDLTWLDSGKPKTKRPRSKKDKQKLNSILDRTSPCPNVDVRTLSADVSKSPSCNTKSVSFLENPSAFLAQQTALVRSSLNSSQSNMFNKSPPSNPSGTLASTTSVCAKMTASVCVTEAVCSTTVAKPSCVNSVEKSENPETSVLPNVSDSAVQFEDKPDESGRPCENTVSTKNQSVGISTETENPDSKSVTQHDEKPNDCKKTSNAKSKSPKSKSRSSILSHFSQTSKSETPLTAFPNITVTSAALTDPVIVTTSSLTVGGMPHISQPGTGDFPASSLLSAAAKAQCSQASPLGLVLGGPLQVNPGLPLNVNPDMSTVGGASLPDILGKSGLSSLDQLCLSFGSGGLAPMMVAQNNMLAGALPGFLNNPALQGLPLNMCLPLGQPVINSGGLNLAQNMMFSGLDPKVLSQMQDKCVNVDSSKSPSLESTKDLTAPNVGPINVQADSVNIANVGGITITGTDVKNLTCTSAPVNQVVSSASNSHLLNNQFPFVTMNTPMPPMSLPVVTNVTNSLSQVIPAVGMPQTILNQHPLAHLLSTVAVPAMNNSVVLNPATQSCAQNIAYLGLPVSGVTSASSTIDKSDERICADANASRTVVAESVDTTEKGDGSDQASVDAQMQETQNLVLFPNINMPMVQVIDGAPIITGMDKLGTVPQVMLPGTILDSQSPLCQSHPGAGLPNLLQLQQMWNSIGGAGVPSINALQMQQLQTLQLQLLLQQLHVQGMQNLVNQINLQGAAVVPDAGSVSSPVAEEEVDSEEQAMQESTEEGDQDDDDDDDDDDESSLEGSTQDETIDQEEHPIQGVCDDTVKSVRKDSIECKASVLQQPSIHKSSKDSEVKPLRVKNVNKKDLYECKGNTVKQPSVRKSSKGSEVKSLRVKGISNSKPYVCTHSDKSGTKLKFVSVSSKSSISSNSMKRSRTDVSVKSSKDSDRLKSRASNKNERFSSEKTSLYYERLNYESFSCQDVSDDFAKSSPDRQSDSSASVFEEETEKHKPVTDSFKDQIVRKKSLVKSESCEDLSSGISGKRTSDSSDVSVNDQALSDSGFTDCSDPSANESHETLPHHGGESTDKSDTGEATEDEDLPLGDLQRKAKKRLYPDEHDVDMDGLENLYEDSMDQMERNSLEDTPHTGDLVWGQIRGFPLWPGKLVPEAAAADVDLGPEYAEGVTTVIVMWYGDHTFTRVEPERLKSWREGLLAHHKTRRRRKGRKMNSNLEAAIQEAMKDVSVDTLPVLRTWRGRTNKKKKT